ncbi:hypothetical protein Leryth_003405 [Lithospermum erythrorhizon]|nr:hypothetical protein Leryth_003405 [Lithospermum erythrorhizon]
MLFILFSKMFKYFLFDQRMGFIFGDLSLIKELKRKLNFILCKPNLNAHGLTKQTKKVLSGRFRFGGTETQRRRLKGRKEVSIIVRDIGETLPKVQEVKSNDNKSASEQGDDRVDDWLSDAFSNGLGNQDPQRIPGFLNDESGGVSPIQCLPRETFRVTKKLIKHPSTVIHL